jgi:hypothetical protein
LSAADPADLAIVRDHIAAAGQGGEEEVNEEDAFEIYLATPSHRFVMNPNSMKRMAWDALLFLFLMTEAISVPLSVGFFWEPWELYFFIVTTVFLSDIVVNFMTGIYHNGSLIMRQSSIAVQYMKSWFVLDIVATVPWDRVFEAYFGTGNTSGAGNASSLLKMAKFSRLIRLFRLAKLQALLQRFEDFLDTGVLIFFNLLRLGGFFLLFCHWLACGIGYVGSDNIDWTRRLESLELESVQRELSSFSYYDYEIGEPGWLIRIDPLANGSLYVQYICAFHWILGILSGSKGQINPANTLERIYEVMLMFFALVVSSFLMAKVIDVVSRMTKERAEFDERMKAISKFMRVHSVPRYFQVKVRKYLEYTWKTRHDVNTDIGLLQYLSPGLRLELQGLLMRKVLNAHAYFCAHPNHVQDALAGLLEMTLCSVDDQVYAKNSRPVGIYLVKSGSLASTNRGRFKRSGTSAPPSESERRGSHSSLFRQSTSSMSNRSSVGSSGQGREPRSTTRITDASGEPAQIHASGTYFGDIGFFCTDEMRHKTVAAVEYSEVYSCPSASIVDLFDVLPSVWAEYEHAQIQVKEGITSGELKNEDTTPPGFLQFKGNSGRGSEMRSVAFQRDSSRHPTSSVTPAPSD